jgi:hypothetical protein
MVDSDGTGAAPAVGNAGTKCSGPAEGDPAQTYVRISDGGAATDYRVNSPAGEYGILNVVECQFIKPSNLATDHPKDYTNVLTGQDVLNLYDDGAGNAPTSVPVGLIYYQAGIVVLDHTLFTVGEDAGGGGLAFDGSNRTAYPPPTVTDGILHWAAQTVAHNSVVKNGENINMSKDDRCMRDYEGQLGAGIGGAGAATHTYATGAGSITDLNDVGLNANTDQVAYNNYDGLLEHGSIDQACNAIRGRIIDLSFNNTTELNSTIYFCRVNHNDFNYSSNPTYLGDKGGGESNSKIRVKRSTLDAPVSYLTTIGLYSADNELLAVAKLSEPLRKDPTNEMTLRVRLDY